MQFMVTMLDAIRFSTILTADFAQRESPLTQLSITQNARLFSMNIAGQAHGYLHNFDMRLQQATRIPLTRSADSSAFR
jgi:hypothetical protein